MTPDPRATAQTRARYQRISSIYDKMETLAEPRYRPWRQQLWSLVEGPTILEVGVGTGKNIPFYPPSVHVTAIDLTPGMLARAKARAASLNASVYLQLGDVQALDFADNTFDQAVATFVFCSVPDPVLGLQELLRVIKPNGRLLLLEHVRSAKPVVAALMDILNPLLVRLSGANINRHTVANVSKAGWQLTYEEDLGMGDIFKLLVAQPAK